MSKPINNIAIEKISQILCDDRFTGSQLTIFLQIHNFKDHDNEHGAIGALSTKWKRLNASLAHECGKTKSPKPLFKAIEYVLDPAPHTLNIDYWKARQQEVNAILVWHSLRLNDVGKVESTAPPTSISDAHNRFSSFKKKLQEHGIHREAMRYCDEELLQNNYFHAIFEASKGVLDRLRQLSKSSSDGITLVDECFIIKKPIIVIKGNLLITDSEKGLYKGLASLLKTIVYLYRHPKAHTPKLYDETSESDAITAFIMISLAHKQLDNCCNINFYTNQQ